MKHVCIIGAGPAGLTAAYQLSKDPNIKVSVIEASKEVGGLCKTFELWGHKVDLGPHRFFTKDLKINQIWEEVLEGQHEEVPRLTRIIYKGKFFDYPIKAWNALTNLGYLEALLCVCSYIKVKLLPLKTTNTFETWVTSRFGARLYNIFFKTYSEKLWGIKCSELHSDFAAQRIKKLSLFGAGVQAVKDIFGIKNTEHISLIDSFKYPYNGTGDVYTRMANKIVQAGGTIYLSEKCNGFKVNNEKIEAIKLGDKLLYCDEVISSMPITLLASNLNPPSNILKSCAKLEFRNTILVYVKFKGQSPFADNWVYVHSKEIKAGRVTNFDNWGRINAKQEGYVLCFEYWTNTEDLEWSLPESAWEATAKKDAITAGFGKLEQIELAHIVKIAKSYPVYKSDYKEHLADVTQFLQGYSNLQAIGRYGAFKYNNQDHSILMGILAAENIEKRQHNLWDVNTDYSSYQENPTSFKK